MGQQCEPKPLPYSPPVGPSSQTHKGPGLGGDNYGTGQTPVCHDRPTGSPGTGGNNHGNTGSQGTH
jgi:hypothetical protein